MHCVPNKTRSKIEQSDKKSSKRYFPKIVHHCPKTKKDLSLHGIGASTTQCTTLTLFALCRSYCLPRNISSITCHGYHSSLQGTSSALDIFHDFLVSGYSQRTLFLQFCPNASNFRKSLLGSFEFFGFAGFNFVF